MEWKNIDWKIIDKEVSSLQRRIYRASQRKEISTVIALQTLLSELASSAWVNLECKTKSYTPHYPREQGKRHPRD
jgi:hypothetical protein